MARGLGPASIVPSGGPSWFVLVRLKWRLLVNGARGQLARQLTLAASAVLGAAGAFFGFLALFSVRLSAEWGPPLVTVGCAAMLVGWLLFPLLGFGSDETLDPARLALFPIPRRPLMLGLFGASLVGVPAVATVVTLLGAVLGYGGGPGTPLVVLNALALLALCVTGSRALVTFLAAALRSRRGRDSAMLGVALAGLLAMSSQFLLPRGDSDPRETLRNLQAAADAIRRTPLGWPGDAFVAAREGRYGTALLETLGLVVLAAFSVWVWSRALDRAVTTVPPAAPERTAGGADLMPRPLRRVLPYGPLAAVVARELRYLVREPRRRAQLLSSAVFATILPIMAFPGGLSGARPFLLLYPAVILGLSGSNVFGFDGPPWWAHLAAGVPARTELLARNLALATYAVPILLLQSVVVVALGSPPGRVATVLAMALGGLGVAVAFADVASVRTAFAVPEAGSNPWATNSNAGCAAGLYGIAAMATAGVVLAPSAVLVVLGRDRPAFLVPAVLLALAAGGGVWWAGVRIASADLDHRAPQILASIDPRRA